MFQSNLEQMVYFFKQLEKNYTIELERLDAEVPGTLTCSLQGERKRFFQTQKIRDTYLRKGITGKSDVIAALCRKAYLKSSLERIRFNLKLAENAVKTFLPMEYHDIRCTMPKRFEGLPEEYFRSFDSRSSQKDSWASNYTQSIYLPEGKTKVTSRGLAVRSMAEVVIAELYYKYELEFRYEEEVEIDRYKFIPDFTVRRRSDQKIFYHEHCGKPHDEKYWKRHKWKLEQYEKLNIVPWDNLIVTYSDRDANVDVRIIESEIKNKLL